MNGIEYEAASELMETTDTKLPPHPLKYKLIPLSVHARTVYMVLLSFSDKLMVMISENGKLGNILVGAVDSKDKNFHTELSTDNTYDIKFLLGNRVRNTTMTTSDNSVNMAEFNTLLTRILTEKVTERTNGRQSVVLTIALNLPSADEVITAGGSMNWMSEAVKVFIDTVLNSGVWES